MDTPLRQLVAQCFRPRTGGPEVATFAQAGPVGTEALVGTATGLDLIAGERLLAATRSVMRPGGYEHRVACAITDRRTVVAGWSNFMGRSPGGPTNERRFNLEHHHVVGATPKKPSFSKPARIEIQVGAQMVTLPCLDLDIDAMGAFYAGLTHIAPQMRAEPRQPLVATSEADPMGFDAVEAGLWYGDERTRRIVGALRASHGAGMPDEMAADLLRRTVVAHRAGAAAPMMMRDGRWLSPLSRDDFGHNLVRILGPPVGHAQVAPEVQAIDFYLPPGQDPVGGAARALGVASFLTLGVGFSPAKMLVAAAAGRKPVTQLRVLLGATDVGTGFQLVTPSGPLEQVDSLLATQLLDVLSAAAFPVLQKRAEQGWAPDFGQLMAS